MDNNWREIERMALHDPVLYAVVARVNQGILSKEEGLIAAVRAYSEQVSVLLTAKKDALMYGDGYAHVRHIGGEFSYRTLFPALVVVKDRV